MTSAKLGGACSTGEGGPLASTAVREALEQILRHLSRVVQYDSAAILLCNGRHLNVAAARGLPASEIFFSLEPAERRTLASFVMHTGRPLVVADVQQDSRWTVSPGTAYIRSWLGAPLLVAGRALGVINVDSRHPGYYAEKDADVLLAFADQAAIALEKAILSQKFRRLHLETILALVQAIETRDPYTSGHSRKVADYAIALGKKLGLPTADLSALRDGALLHDIGKIGISDTILLKPGELSPEERAAIQTHPMRGWEIVGNIAQLHYVKPVILWHHERYDGGGYPDGLAGEAIPLLSRITAVADSFEAMSSARAYRRALALPRIIGIFQADQGKQWDPQVVKALLADLAANS